MFGFIIVVCVILAIVLYFKWKIAKNKPVEQRSSLEKILTALGTKHQKNMEDAANAIRTPEISKEEGLQRCKQAIKDLESDFRVQLAALINRKENLKDQLPKLKQKPGILQGKALTNKKKMEEAEKEGKTELAKNYKSNAILFLDLKKKAEARITKAEKTIEETEVVIDSSKASYEAKKFILDDLLAEFETMTSNISTYKFNQSIEVIQSLKRETADKLRTMNAEIEAGNIINDSNNDTGINESEFEDEFNKL